MTTNRAAKKAAPAAAPIEPPADVTAAGDANPTAAPQPTVAPKPSSAPLAPTEPPNTAPAAPLMAPLPAVPMGADAFLGYVDDQGETIAPDDLFDLGGIGTIVVAKVRANALIQRGGSKTTLMSLAFPAGMEVNRATAREAIDQARAATVAAAGDN